MRMQLFRYITWILLISTVGYAEDSTALFFSAPLKGSDVVRHVGKRGDRFKMTPLGVFGKHTLLSLDLARLVGSGPKLEGPTIHELLLDSSLHLAGGTPLRAVRVAVFLALYGNDGLITTLHSELSMPESQVTTYGLKAANFTRDLVALDEADMERVTRYEITYYEDLTPLSEPPRQPITPSGNDKVSRAESLGEAEIVN